MRRSGRAVAALALVAATVLAGCARLPTMPWQSEEDIIRLEDFAGCRLEGSDGRRVSCANPLTPRPTQPEVPDGWICVGGRPRDDETFGFHVHRRDGSGELGLSYEVDRPADRYSGWIRVDDRNDLATYNVTSEHAAGFVAFPDVRADAGERARIQAGLAAIRYTVRSEPLGSAEKHPTWIPANGSDPAENGFDWWIVHRFETGDETYTFTRREPRNLRIEGRSLDLTVEMETWQINWSGNVLAPSEDC